jgi:poly(3-hydroxybutyrate) depolymerase
VRALFALGFTAGSPGIGLADETTSITLPSGATVSYALVLPEPYDPAGSYAALLAFPGGGQRIEAARGTVERFWESEAIRRDLIVVAPAALSPSKFWYTGDDAIALLPELVAALRQHYAIGPGPIHVAGHSNGGISAFRAAVRFPDLFQSLTVLAGWPADPGDFGRLDRLAGLRIAMFVGERDRDWREPMAFTHARLQKLGIAAEFTVVPGSGHGLEGAAGERAATLFSAITAP